MPVLGVAGLSLSLVTGTSAAIGGASPDITRNRGHEVTLSEEEISDVSLGTFYIVDEKNTGTFRPRVRLAMGACGGAGCGCGGCGCSGCGGCWAGNYFGYGPPPIWNNAYPPPEPIRPAHKYRHIQKRTDGPENR